MTLVSPSGFLRCGIICALAAIQSGCALWKPPSQSQVLTNALPEGTAIPPHWKAGGNRKEVSADWLRSFHDPGLNAVVAEAIRNNLDLRRAAAQVEIARQNVALVASNMKPQVGLDLNYSGLRDDVRGHNHWYESKKGLAGVAWEADVWGKLRSQTAAAQAGYEATALDYAFARQSLAATTAKSWYLTIETSQLVALWEQSVKIYSDLLALVQTKRNLGKVSDLDVVEASANLNSAQSSLRQAQSSAIEAQRQLEVLVGRYPAAEVKVARNFAAVPPPVRAGLPSLLLDRRPDVVAAERLVLAAFREQEAAKLALLPSFSLTLEGGKLSDHLLSVLQVNPWIVHAAVGMSVPIYTGGALQAQIKIATAQQERAVAGYGDVVLTAFREVENGLTNENLLAQRLWFEKKTLSDRTEAVRISKVQYEAGEIDMLSVLILQEYQITTQGNVITLCNAQLANRINLHLALGGSFDSTPP